MCMLVKCQLAEPAGRDIGLGAALLADHIQRPVHRALVRLAPVGPERGLGGLSDWSQPAGQCPPPRYDAFNFYFQ
jgi:hypothetical protein